MLRNKANESTQAEQLQNLMLLRVLMLQRNGGKVWGLERNVSTGDVSPVVGEAG